MKGAALAVVAGLAVIATAVAIHLLDAGSVSGAAVHVPVVDRGTVPSTTLRTTTTGAPGGAIEHRGHHGVPAGSRLHIGRFDVDAPIVSVRVVDGVMQIPRDPGTVGWWRGGAGPGDDTGSVVVVGHVNYAGTTGALAVLPDTRPGDAITLDEPRTHLAYRVDAVRTYPKTSGIPSSVFSTAGPTRLVLITCGGPFDGQSGNYEDNIVVYASPT